ncbi:MAG: DUF2207 domain-containing protein [Lacisediminihabitans sp.]
MTRFLRFFAAFAAPLGALLIVCAPLPASALPSTAVEISAETGVQDFTFTSYSADYYVARDAEGHSTLRTVETIVAKFPNFDQNRGIIRAIPNDYDGVPLHTAVASVTDALGAPVHFDATDSGGFTELALGTDDYVHGKQSYVITYTQQNVVRSFADTGDELYWDTNGTGFAQPFGSVTARVHVDPAVAEFLTGNHACYRGAQGSTDTCAISQTMDDESAAAGGQLFTAQTQEIGPHENLTVSIGFIAGTFVQVPADDTSQDPGYSGDGYTSNNPFNLGQTPWWSNLVAFLFLGLGGLGAVFAVVQRAFLGKRNAKGRGIIIPQYSPPKDLTLLEAANLIGKAENGISAQLVSFAVRGIIRILDYPVTGAGNDYTLQLVNAKTEGAQRVDPVESRMLGMLFGADLVPGATCEIGVQNDSLARKLATLKASVAGSLIARGLRSRTSIKSGLVTLFGLVLLLVGSVMATVLLAFVGALSGWMFLAIPVIFMCVIVAAGVLVKPAALTDSGAEQRDYLLGVRDYLQLAEADRFRMLQSPEGAERVDVGNTAQLVKLYEKLLPFAVLWGIEREWSKELAVYYDTGVASPDWYVSSSAFNSVLFAQTLGGLASSVTTTATPTPVTSSWSGSSGGSFSGGSFGGGFSGGGGGGGGGGGR